VQTLRLLAVVFAGALLGKRLSASQ